MFRYTEDWQARLDASRCGGLIASLQLADGLGLASVVRGDFLDQWGFLVARRDEGEKVLWARVKKLKSFRKPQAVVRSRCLEAYLRRAEAEWGLGPCSCPETRSGRAEKMSAFARYLGFLESVAGIHRALSLEKMKGSVTNRVNFKDGPNLDLTKIADVHQAYVQLERNAEPFRQCLIAAYDSLTEAQQKGMYVEYSKLLELGCQWEAEGKLKPSAMKPLCAQLEINPFDAARALYVLRERVELAKIIFGSYLDPHQSASFIETHVPPAEADLTRVVSQLEARIRALSSRPVAERVKSQESRDTFLAESAKATAHSTMTFFAATSSS